MNYILPYIRWEPKDPLFLLFAFMTRKLTDKTYYLLSVSNSFLIAFFFFTKLVYNLFSVSNLKHNWSIYLLKSCNIYIYIYIYYWKFYEYPKEMELEIMLSDAGGSSSASVPRRACFCRWRLGYEDGTFHLHSAQWLVAMCYHLCWS